MKVVLLPINAFGHLIPFYHLAIALGKAGVHVYYVSTPRIIKRLPKVPPNLSHLVNFVHFPMPVPADASAPLPEGAEATIDVPIERIDDLIMTYDLLQHPLKQFMIDNSPDWLIADFLLHWASDVARECNVPFMSFLAFSAATTSFFGPPKFLFGEGQERIRSTPESLTSSPDWVTFPSIVAFRPSEAKYAHRVYYGNDLLSTSPAIRLGKVLEGSQAVAIRTCNEIEENYLKSLEKTLGKPVIPVGVLPPPEERMKRDPTDEKWAEIFEWLDKQKPKSVVFVGFGSECKLTKDQITEIARGLEESGLPFLWALNRPIWAVDDLDALPPGFADRMSGLGRVSFGWAPQLEILGHPAVGCTFFHSGWGSAIEVLKFGHSMVVLPLMNDQGLTARLLVEKGFAIEVEKSVEDGSFSGKDIAKCLRQAMAGDSEDGESMKRRVKEASEILGDVKLHDQYIDRFVTFLQLKNGVAEEK